MRRIYIYILVAIVGLSFYACTTQTTEPTSSPNPNDTPSGDLKDVEKELIASTNVFGLKIFKNIAASESPETNIFVSPLSISFALGMTYNGAAGETREAMAATLELSGLEPEAINQSYRNVIDLLTQLDPAVVFNIANSIWYRTGFPISSDFVDLNQTYFDAEVRDIDFSQIWAADTINHWVDLKTNGKIDEIIQPPISPETVMFLINALYFNGNWTLPFDTGSTVDMLFFPSDGSTVTRPMMRTDTTLRYFSNDLFQAVDLPYGDQQFSMAVFLPQQDQTVDDIIQQLDETNWAAWVGSFHDQDLELSLPKFKFGFEIELNDILKAMGMSVAFDPLNADFSNMVSDMDLLYGNLFISLVKHKTFVQVDEEGTEAAAVTIVAIDLTSIDPDGSMTVNRPFLFVIHEKATGSILFMGTVDDPVWEDD